MSGETVWLPGILTLVVGLALGALLAWNLRRTAPAAPASAAHGRKRRDPAPVTSPDAPSFADLEAQRNTLVQQLRELDLDSGRRDSRALELERDELEREAARILRAIDRAASGRSAKRGAASGAETAQAPADTATPAAATAGPSGGSTLRGALWGSGVTALAFGMILYVSQVATPRGANMQITGTVPPGAAPVMAGAGGGMPGADPNAPPLDIPPDKPGRLELVRNLLAQDRYVEAFQVAQVVLKDDPDDARALSYSAVVRLVMGQDDKAMELTERAVLHAQNQPEVWLTRGFVASRSGKWSAAVEAFEQATKVGGPLDEPLQKMLADAKQHVANADPEVRPPREAGEGESAEGGEGGEAGEGADEGEAAPTAAPAAGAMPAGHPPMGGGAMPPAHPAMAEGAPAAGGPGIRGTITLGAGASAPAPGTTLFVYVRPDGVTGGPPSAVKRMQITGFPITFALGPENSMMGQPFPAKATVEARADADGNPLTHGPGDLVARATGVTTPADGLTLELAPAQ